MPKTFSPAYTHPMTTTMQWDAARYASEAAFVPQLAASLVDLLAPLPGEHILDVGCGDGALTAQIAARGCEVLGIDSSPEQLLLARARGLQVALLDAHALPYASAFDGVLSNAALHWMLDPARVLAGIWQALKPGGRLVAEMGGAGNIARIVAALNNALGRRDIDPAPLNPWYFPSPGQYAALLEAQGYTVRSLQFFERPTPFKADVGNWLTLMAVPFLNALPDDATRRAVIDEVREELRAPLLDAHGVWQLDYVRLRLVAVKASDAQR